jgi:hypothetical protein
LDVPLALLVPAEVEEPAPIVGVERELVPGPPLLVLLQGTNQFHDKENNNKPKLIEK